METASNTPETNVTRDKQNRDRTELVFLLTIQLYHARLIKAVNLHVASLVSETRSEAERERERERERECCCNGETVYYCTAKPEDPRGRKLPSRRCNLPRGAHTLVTREREGGGGRIASPTDILLQARV
jgi:hypothetical protein